MSLDTSFMTSRDLVADPPPIHFDLDTSFRASYHPAVVSNSFITQLKGITMPVEGVLLPDRCRMKDAFSHGVFFKTPAPDLSIGRFLLLGLFYAV
jgi:hypothetical protein